MNYREISVRERYDVMGFKCEKFSRLEDDAMLDSGVLTSGPFKYERIH